MNAAESARANFERLAQAFAQRRDVRAGRVFSGHDLRVNGKIFAMCARSGFVVKLPRNRVDELIARSAGTRFEPGKGRVMKEWILIDLPESQWHALAEEAYDYVKGLKK